MAVHSISGAAAGVPSTFAVFIMASVLLAITPGPGVLYLVTRTLGQGRAAGLQSIGGVALGNLASAVVASFGVAVILAASAVAFTALKFLGATYLAFLGLRALRPRDASRDVVRETVRAAHFCDGFLVALLNPKTALFFAAFLPQFVDANSGSLAQSLYLSGLFVSIAACTDTLYVLAADAIGPRILGRYGAARSRGRYLTAAVFLALGIYLALSDLRSSR